MGGPRERRSADHRREQLIDAALAILATDGLPATTTRRVTEEAGLALGAFHYVFPGKPDLLRAVIERIATGISPVLRTAVTDLSADLETVVVEMIEGFWALVEATPDLQLAQYELTVHALRDPDLQGLAAWQYDRYADAVAQVLDDVPDLPAGPPRDEVARFIVSIIDGLVLQFVIQRDPAAARRRLAMFTRLVQELDLRELAVAGGLTPARLEDAADHADEASARGGAA